MPKKKSDSNHVAFNRKAHHHYFIYQTFEAGLCLQGWEVKSIRAGRVQITEAFVTIKNQEVFLLGCLINPLPTSSSHIIAKPRRERKLLLNRIEINKLVGITEHKGYTVVPLSLFWKHGKLKLKIGVAQGKKTFDKRQSKKQRDWQRQKARLLRHR